jgi:hypothetical protein
MTVYLSSVLLTGQSVASVASAAAIFFYRLKKEGHYALPVGLIDGAHSWVFEQQIFIDDKPLFYAFANQTKNLTGAEVFAQYSTPSE